MNLKMINVGFGDCFILYDEISNESFIIDFGSRGFRNSNFSNIGKLAEHIKSNYIDNNIKSFALITHFHIDHYKGFEYLAKHYSNIFDTIYIPYLYIEDDNYHKAILLELAIYYYLFLDENSYTWQISDKILNHIKIVTKLAKNNNVICLSSWDSFIYSNRNFEVIWPDKVIHFEEALVEYALYFEKKTIDLNDFNDIKNKILDNMKKWYEYTSNKTYKDNDEYKNQINEITMNQNKYLEELNELRHKYNGLIAKEDNYKSIKYYSTKLFSQGNNATSIVFHDMIDKNQINDDTADTTKLNKMILMTGDIEATIVNKYLIKRFHSQKYYILKVPHHGTKSHYTTNLPKAENILISTGPRRGYGKIAEEYRDHQDINDLRACTCGYIYCNIISKLEDMCFRNKCRNNDFHINI